MDIIMDLLFVLLIMLLLGYWSGAICPRDDDQQGEAAPQRAATHTPGKVDVYYCPYCRTQHGIPGNFFVANGLSKCSRCKRYFYADGCTRARTKMDRQRLREDKLRARLEESDCNQARIKAKILAKRCICYTKGGQRLYTHTFRVNNIFRNISHERTRHTAEYTDSSSERWGVPMKTHVGNKVLMQAWHDELVHVYNIDATLNLATLSITIVNRM